MGWFAIRNIYLFDTKPDGTNIFEERIVCFEGKSEEEAHQKADAESKIYASENGLIVHTEQIGYEQDGEDLIDGHEIWSQLYESEDTLEEFYKKRYEQFKYTVPDDGAV